MLKNRNFLYLLIYPKYSGPQKRDSVLRCVSKKKEAQKMSVGEKIKCIDPKDPALSIGRQCDLLGMPRSSYYRPRVFTFESNENLVPYS